MRWADGVKFAGQTEALRVDIEQSNEPRMSARRDGGAVVRVERRRRWSDDEKLAILKETTHPGAIMAVVACQSARKWGPGSACNRGPGFDALTPWRDGGGRSPEASRHGVNRLLLRRAQLRFLKRQLSLPVSMMSQ